MEHDDSWRRLIEEVRAGGTDAARAVGDGFADLGTAP
jgi:hypothetical protein